MDNKISEGKFMYAQKDSKILSPKYDGWYIISVNMATLYGYCIGILDLIILEDSGKLNIETENLILYRYGYILYFKTEADRALFKLKYGL